MYTRAPIGHLPGGVNIPGVWNTSQKKRGPGLSPGHTFLKNTTNETRVRSGREIYNSYRPQCSAKMHLLEFYISNDKITNILF